MIALVRVDNRLIHGQVVETWIPSVKASRVVVADDAAAANPLMRAAMGLAVPASVKVEVRSIAEADFGALEGSPDRVLVLVREVADALKAHARGLPLPSLNLGNVHFANGRVQISASVFLSPAEICELRALCARGTALDVRAVPKEKALGLADVEAKVTAAAATNA